MQNLETSQLDTVVELEALPGTENINATRHIFYMQNLLPS